MGRGDAIGRWEFLQAAAVGRNRHHANEGNGCGKAGGRVDTDGLDIQAISINAPAGFAASVALVGMMPVPSYCGSL